MSSLEAALTSSEIIRHATYKGEDLADFHIVEARFHDCQFTDCTFDAAIFQACAFINCRFAHCSFRDARFEACLFTDSEAHSGCEWFCCNLSEARYSKCSLGMNRIVKSDAFLTQFMECSASGLHFEAEVHRRISKKLMTGGVIFEKCKLQYAVFAAGNYDSSRFEASDLRDVDFAGSNCNRASFAGSSLNNCDFTGATLDAAILAHATFDSLDLTSMQSHHDMTVSRDQHEALLRGMGLRTLD
jgi:fluoroquinolone resistance protein